MAMDMNWIFVALLGLSNAASIAACLWVAARQRRREIREGWCSRRGGVYRLTHIDVERDSLISFQESLFKLGEDNRKSEVRLWLGKGDFDAEIARVDMRNKNRSTSAIPIRG